MQVLLLDYQFLVVQKPSEMSINGIRMKYTDFLPLLSIFEGTVNMN